MTCILSSSTEASNLQQLQHGLAHFSIQALILKQLFLQTDWLPQVGVGCAEDVVQLHCCLNPWSPSLLKGVMMWGWVVEVT